MILRFFYNTTIPVLMLAMTAAIGGNLFAQNLFLTLHGEKENSKNPEHPINNDYSKVDTYIHSLHGEKFANMEVLADSISKNFSEEADRVRAIFIWITDNIAYDCEQYHSKKQPYFTITQKRKEKPRDFKKRWKAELKKWDREQAKQCFEKQKGVCEDYALLFKYLCGYSGIQCEIVSGNAKPHGLPQGRHSWNKVKIYGKWYPLDVTWASGYVDKKVRQFTKEFNEKYFLPDPDDLVKTHFEKTK